MTPHPLIQAIHDTKLVAILRARSSTGLLNACEALREAGLRAVEVTMTTAGALDTIRAARQGNEADFWFGAGSVVSVKMARECLEAGAQFIVTPVCVPEVIHLCKDQGIPVFPGAFSPTEIYTAWEAGADMVKIFPSSLGGPALIKALKAPLPYVEMMAVGGVEVSNAAQFLRSGASALGVGSSLVNDELVSTQNFAEIKKRALEFVAAVQRV